MKKSICVEGFEEVLEREVVAYEKSNSGLVIVPKKHKGKKAIIIIGGEVK